MYVCMYIYIYMYNLQAGQRGPNEMPEMEASDPLPYISLNYILV